MLTKQEELTVLAMFVPNADLISDAARAEKLQYGTPVRWFQEHRGAAITVRQHTYPIRADGSLTGYVDTKEWGPYKIHRVTNGYAEMGMLKASFEHTRVLYSDESRCLVRHRKLIAGNTVRVVEYRVKETLICRRSFQQHPLSC